VTAYVTDEPPRVHPAKLLLVERRVRILDVARIVGCSPSFAARALNASCPPSPRLKAALSAYLGVPEDELFLPDSRRFRRPCRTSVDAIKNARRAGERARREFERQSTPR
jgi:transcriptional regulator with XRE-family HTH domain